MSFSTVGLKFNCIMIKKCSLYNTEASFVTWHEANFHKPSTCCQLSQAGFYLTMRSGLFVSCFQCSAHTNVPVSASDGGVPDRTAWIAGLPISPWNPVSFFSLFSHLFVGHGVRYTEAHCCNLPGWSSPDWDRLPFSHYISVSILSSM